MIRNNVRKSVLCCTVCTVRLFALACNPPAFSKIHISIGDAVPKNQLASALRYSGTLRQANVQHSDANPGSCFVLRATSFHRRVPLASIMTPPPPPLSFAMRSAVFRKWTREAKQRPRRKSFTISARRARPTLRGPRYTKRLRAPLSRSVADLWGRGGLARRCAHCSALG